MTPCRHISVIWPEIDSLLKIQSDPTRSNTQGKQKLVRYSGGSLYPNAFLPYLDRGDGIRPPPRFFLLNSKTPGDIEKKLSDFNFTPLMDILRLLSITIVVRCCHSNLLFPVCHVIFWVEKTKKLELFSR